MSLSAGTIQLTEFFLVGSLQTTGPTRGPIQRERKNGDEIEGAKQNHQDSEEQGGILPQQLPGTDRYQHKPQDVPDNAEMKVSCQYLPTQFPFSEDPAHVLAKLPALNIVPPGCIKCLY